LTVDLVCLPWFGMTRAATSAALDPAFAGTDVRVHHWDLPGHGDRPADCEPTSQAVLNTVATWIERRFNAPILLAGASYGAYLAAGVARQRPDLVRGLLLICPGVRMANSDRDLPPPDDVAGPVDLPADVPEPLRAHFAAALGQRAPEVIAAVVDALQSGNPGDEEFKKALRTGRGYALPDEDADVTFPGPVSVLTGRQDRVVGYADQFRAMRHYPHGTFAIVDEAGHYLPFEQPTLLAALTHDWLRRVLP
jgi:pimeloyl-ACP methyl ester carboxylesterase